MCKLVGAADGKSNGNTKGFDSHDAEWADQWANTHIDERFGSSPSWYSSPYHENSDNHH